MITLVPPVYPSRLAEVYIHVMGEPFRFEGREYLQEIYDVDSRELLLVCGRQTEKTVWEDSELLRPGGSVRKIKDTFVGDQIVGLLADGSKLGIGEVTWKSRRYQKPCLLIRTRQGHEISAGRSHPIRQWGKWTAASCLQLGDKVAAVHKADYLDMDLFWDEVVEIRDVGETWCYDVSTTLDSFVADGFVTHNSTTLGNKLILYAFVYGGIRILYISPSDRQTKTFSLERIRHPLLTSPRLRPYVDMKNLSVYDPKFGKDARSLSIIKLRSAYLTADRVRGERADIAGLDEYQDLLVENIPVIRECMFHGNIEWRRILYSGTPKTLGNPIERLWLGSTMTELMFPCRKHGESNKPHTWHWFPITESCIGKFGLICPKCGGQIHHLDPMATWVDSARQRERQVKGYHISQLITPMAHEVSTEGRRAWDDILTKRERYPRGKFMNEVMGVSYDYGTQPLCEADLASCQVSNWLMEPTELMEMMTLSGSNAIYAGIDWSGEEYAYTVITLGTYARSPSPDRLFQFYWHRFEGKEDDREVQLERIYDLLRVYNVKYVVADYGMGHYQNTWLANRLGPHRYVIMQYVGKQQKKVRWNPNLQRLTAYKSAVCSDYINAIKAGKIAFPAWNVFSQPCGEDFLNLRGEYVDKRDETMYVHGAESPVDSFHAGLYCLYASVIDHPRPDITRITFDEGEADALDASALSPLYR